MKALNELVLPAEIKYTDEHIWARAQGDEILVGISDFAQDQLGEVMFVELPGEGDKFAAAEPFGVVESYKSVNKLFMPVSGEVTAVNSVLEDTPTLLNVSPYENGWIIKIKADNAADLDGLLSADGYLAFLSK